jgi:hypothetical protein
MIEYKLSMVEFQGKFTKWNEGIKVYQSNKDY